jgi:type II secretory pathway pseudopilin PulG
MTPAKLVRQLRAGSDEGFTLVELLVATTLSLMIGVVVVSTLVTSQKAVNTTISMADINGEARSLLNRLAGDLRQATPVTTTTSGVSVETPAITAVQNPYPGGTSAVTSITFNADFSGDGCIAGITSDKCSPAPAVDPSNPETETFCWLPPVAPATASSVYLIPSTVATGTCGPVGTAEPLMSGQVTSLQIYCDSSNYLYDTNGDGLTTWQEIDDHAPPIGTGTGASGSGTNTHVLTQGELTLINSVLIVVQVKENGHAQTYQTLVSLRNV